jgi:hypothetical protein
MLPLEGGNNLALEIQFKLFFPEPQALDIVSAVVCDRVDVELIPGAVFNSS